MTGEPTTFRNLYSALHETEGADLLRELRMLKDTAYTLKSNYEELNEMDVWFQEQGISIQPMDKLGQLESFQREYLRRLHNYLTAVYSLINHTQRINTNFGSDAFADRYTAELNERGLVERGEFLRQLRHYTQKRKFPPIDVTLIQKDDGIRFGIVVLKEELMDWDEWNNDAEEFLKDVGSEVDIQVEVRKYHSRVGDFYKWYYVEIQSDCDDAIEERADIIEEIDEKRSDLFDGI